MNSILISIIVVTLNAEQEIENTINSIKKQIYSNYEVIVKDGGSKDFTLSHIPNDPRYHIVIQADKSVYDAMNQAIKQAEGKYLFFLNAGDSLYDDNVLFKISCFIDNESIKNPCVLYGDYCRNQEYIQNQKRKLDDFFLYRRPLCHQSILYHRDIFLNNNYNTNFIISADHDLTLRIWKANTPFYHIGVVICNYIGGGISETEKGLMKAKEEKELILKEHYSFIIRAIYNFLILCSLSPVRSWLDSIKSPSILRNAYRGIRNRILR